MDYLSLNSEWDTRANWSEKDISLIDKINTLMKTMIKYGNNYCIKCNVAVESFISEVVKEKLCTTTKEFFIEFAELFKDHLNHIQTVYKLIEKEIVDKFNQFSIDQTKKDEKILGDFTNLIEKIKSNKNSLEKQKHEYFISWKAFTDQEEKNKRAKVNGKLKDDEVKKLDEYKKKAQKESSNYKDSIDKINKLLENSEKSYLNIKDYFLKSEEEKINFNKMQFNKFQEICLAAYEERIEYSRKMLKVINKISIKRDMRTISNYFDFLNSNKTRFTEEEFLNYEFLLSNNNNIDNDMQSEEIKMSSIESIKKIQNDNDVFVCNVDITNIEKKEEPDIKGSKKYEPFVKKLLNSEDQITTIELNSIMHEIIQKNYSGSRLNIIGSLYSSKNSTEYQKQLIGTLYSHYKTKLILQIKNLENMHHLSNILIVIMNNSLDNNELFYLNFLILFIAEKTVYIDPKNPMNKLYLCKLISKNTLFMDNEFWMKLIEIRIAALTDKEVKKLIEKRESINKQDSKKMIITMKKMFSFKEKENKKIGKEILYNQLTKEQLPKVAVQIIEDYIQHFSNFNQEISESFDIILDLSLKYKFNKEYVNYFNALLQSNVFTVKNKKVILRGIEKYENVKPSYFTEKFFDTKNRNIILIGNSLKYLLPIDFGPIFVINREFNSHFSKIIYQNILKKHHDMSLETRIKIWKILLNYYETKRMYNYHTILQEKENAPKKKERDIIVLDVQRTNFDFNIETNREKITRILNAAKFKNTEIQYSQGMNYVAAFLLAMMDYDEEEAFYFYFSLLLYTDYGQLFKEDLKFLRKYFYVFDRLLNIFMPELYFYIKNNNITVTYFVSPWFITLYTRAFQYIKHKNNPKVLIKIWDLFLLYGWKSVVKVGLSLIKTYEDKLISLPFEELLIFIINEIIKSEFFDNDNFDISVFSTFDKATEEKLFKNIEMEYEIKQRIHNEEFE